MGKTIIAILITLLGLYYIFNFDPNKTESFENVDKLKGHHTNDYKNDGTAERVYKCPNVLIQKGNTFYLHNNKVAKVPGVNPLKFDSLEDYTEFLKWQRSQGINCPILYVRETYDAQGNRVFNARPSPTEQMGGLQNLILTTPTKKRTKLIDSSRNDPPFNNNSYPGFDKDNQYVGIHTPLDKMYNSDSVVSPNPMDDNWGGHRYTQKMLDSGYYREDEVWAWH